MHCPWADEHTGDSGETEAVWYAAGTGGYEQGHYKCLHAHCAKRTDAEFLHALPELRRAFARTTRAERQALLAHLTGRWGRALPRFQVDDPTLLHLAAQEAALWDVATRLTGGRTPDGRA